MHFILTHGIKTLGDTIAHNTYQENAYLSLFVDVGFN